MALPGIAAHAAGPPPYKTTVGKSKPIYDDYVVEEYRVPTKWGRLYGVVERPVVPKGVKTPVILTYTPYSATYGASPLTTSIVRDSLSEYFVPRGYARAMFDVVGTNGSSGCFDYGGIRERKTGARLVDWLGERPWSNGRVGMIGRSYDGTTEWATAIEAPEHLTTIVPQVAIGRWYDYAYMQGVRLYAGYGTPWAFDFGLGLIPPTHTGPPDPDAVTDHVQPCERVEHNTRSFLPDPVYDQFWDERDYLARIGHVRASVMIEGSWKDNNVHPLNSIEMWEALPAGVPKKLVMAQQGHNDADLPDSDEIRHAWFDYWLLGLDTGVMQLPSVDSLVNTNARFQDRRWPPPGARTTTLELADKEGPDVMGLVDGPETVWVDDNPGITGASAIAGRGAGADLLFLGAPVRHDLRIAGTPRLDATVVTSTNNTWLTPVLYAQDETGVTHVITAGMLNARNRFGLRRSVPLEPGKPWRGRVEFQPIDYVVPKGSRIGVAVMSMNKDEALYWGGSLATNELLLGGKSRLLLPVAPARP